MNERRLTPAQIREVDRRAIETFGIPGIVLMENAGRRAAEVALTMLSERGGTSAFIACGTGNNGGDGWVMARHLMNAGIVVGACLCGDADRMANDAAIHYAIVTKMGLDIAAVSSPEDLDQVRALCERADLLVDALLGTGFRGEVRSPMAEMIGLLNAAGAPILAVDVPSGLDGDTGKPANATVQARITVTFVAEKTGFGRPEARKYLGDVVVADIGAPHGIIDEV